MLHWQAGTDIIIEEDLYIDSVCFTIDPGVNVFIKSGCSIYLGDKYPVQLTAIGTEEKPINFTPYNPSGNPDSAYWGSIIPRRMFDSLVSPTFEHCNFIKGGGEGSDAVITTKTGSLKIINCLIDYSLNYGILSNHNGGFKEFSGNTIKHTANHPISIAAYHAHTIGINNNIISDSPNLGIYLTSDGLSVGNESIIWHAQTVPFIIPLNFSANSNSNSTGAFIIEKGTTIAMGEDAYFRLGNHVNFLAVGESDQPIKFTSLKLNPQPGDWNGISFNNGSITIDNCIFEYGGKYESSFVDNGMLKLYSTTSISIDNCILRYSEATAILLYKSASNLPYPNFTSFANNHFVELESYAISLYAQAIPSIDISNYFNNHKIFVESSTISSGHLLWKNLGTDYCSDSFITINGEPGTTVEIEPGVKIKWDGGGIKVTGDATIKAIGTEIDPIIFTSAKEEPSWGDWHGILFYSNSMEGNILDYCQVLYAGELSYSIKQASIHIWSNIPSVTITNSTIAHSSHYGICKSSSADPVLENNTFFDNLEGDIITIGN